MPWTSKDLLSRVAAGPGKRSDSTEDLLDITRCWAKSHLANGSDRQCSNYATDEKHLFLCPEHHEELLP